MPKMFVGEEEVVSKIKYLKDEFCHVESLAGVVNVRIPCRKDRDDELTTVMLRTQWLSQDGRLVEGALLPRATSAPNAVGARRRPRSIRHLGAAPGRPTADRYSSYP